MPDTKTGTIAVTVSEQAGGYQDCVLTLTWDGQPSENLRVSGQTVNHAIANALETLARRYRKGAESEQRIDWEPNVPPKPQGMAKQRYHVILHYERLAEETSKFEAFHNTVVGNTAIENAEIAIVQIDPELPIKPWNGRQIEP